MKLQIIKKAIFSIMLISISMSSFAEWSGSKQIANLKIQGDGVYLVLKDFENTSLVCPGTNTFFLTATNDEVYDTKISFLLAALMSKAPVNISFYGCNPDYNSHLNLGSVSLS